MNDEEKQQLGRYSFDELERFLHVGRQQAIAAEKDAEIVRLRAEVARLRAVWQAARTLLMRDEDGRWFVRTADNAVFYSEDLQALGAALDEARAKTEEKG